MPVAAPSVIRPAFLWVPPSAVGTLGDEAAELAIQLEQEVREEERIALRALMPTKANGMPAGLEAGIITGRQQVKTWAMRQALIHDAWVTKVGRCMWSAHRTKTSDDTFEELTSLVESFDWLRKRVRRVYSGNGNHKLVFADPLTSYPTMGNPGKQKTTRTVEFGARENGPTGRGRTKINRLTLDEWLMGTKAMKGAQVPMMGAAGDRYIRYGSSPGLLTSEDLRALRQRGRMGVLDPSRGDPSLSWVEWTSERVRLVVEDGRSPRLVRVLPACADPDCTHVAGEAQGCRLDNIEDVVRASCPAYGTLRLTEEFVAQERLTLDAIEYARERAGIWEDPPDEDAVDDVLAGWGECGDPDAAPADPLVLALDVAHDSKSAVIVACGGHDSMPCLEVVDYRPKRGVSWIPNRLAELATKHSPAAVTVCSGGPVMALVKRREDSPTGWVIESKAGKEVTTLDVVVVGAADQAAASQAFAQDVAGAKLRHRGEQAMAISVRDAVRQFSGDGWRWSRRQSKSDISPLVAGVAARHVWAAGQIAPYDPLANFMPNVNVEEDA